MIGYHRPMFAAKAPIMKQGFDLVDESDNAIPHSQVKCKSLDDYDSADFDGEHTWLDTMLDRWGDRRLGRMD